MRHTSQDFSSASSVRQSLVGCIRPSTFSPKSFLTISRLVGNSGPSYRDSRYQKGSGKWAVLGPAGEKVWAIQWQRVPFAKIKIGQDRPCHQKMKADETMISLLPLCECGTWQMQEHALMMLPENEIDILARQCRSSPRLSMAMALDCGLVSTHVAKPKILPSHPHEVARTYQKALHPKGRDAVPLCCAGIAWPSSQQWETQWSSVLPSSETGRQLWEQLRPLLSWPASLQKAGRSPSLG